MALAWIAVRCRTQFDASKQRLRPLTCRMVREDARSGTRVSTEYPLGVKPPPLGPARSNSRLKAATMMARGLLVNV
jgi:hypothetical protein